MRELHVQPCSAAQVDVVGAAPTASSVWARRSADELHVVLLQVVPAVPALRVERRSAGKSPLGLPLPHTGVACLLMLGCVRRPGIEPGVSRVSGERRDRLARGGWSTRQVPPLVPPVCRTGALLVSYASMRTVSGTDQSRTDDLRSFRPALFQLSYGPRCPVPQANMGQERAGGGNRTRSSWVEARCAATSTSPAGRSNLEWMAGLEPASARRQRAALPLSYTHVDGRRDGIRTRAGLSPDRFAGGRLRLLGHSALAAEEGLEPRSTG